MVHLDNFFHDRICYTNKLGVTIILQLSQQNGKLPLSQQKQGNSLVIPIYATYVPVISNNVNLDCQEDRPFQEGMKVSPATKGKGSHVCFVMHSHPCATYQPSSSIYAPTPTHARLAACVAATAT